MSLEQYRRKRDFKQSPEPLGRGRRGRGVIFVVQKHEARRLHYDFRIAIKDVLVSWAVPKGPSMNPADKRLAVRTEDHPLEYADFEGVIPEGQYGAGAVMVWDRGTYEWLGAVPPDKQIAHGKIDIVLHGQKLRGSFAVVRVGKGTVRASHEDRWLLIKRRDQYSDPSWNIEKPEFDHSVLTGRALKQIKEGDSEKSARRTRSRVRA